MKKLRIVVTQEQPIENNEQFVFFVNEFMEFAAENLDPSYKVEFFSDEYSLTEKQLEELLKV